MNFKINIEKDVIDLIKIYSNYQFEVGGMIFGTKIFNKYILKTLSLKKGESVSINFSMKDKIIYQLPEKQKIIGTWHLHPMQYKARPSITDVNQWKNWKKKYMHIICTKNDFKIFDNKGKSLYEHNF